jgi:uncharacterized protein (TIGR02246 family)
MRTLALLVCGVFLLTLSSSALAQGHSDAEAAIRKGSKAWEAAWNSGDAAALAALYADDAVVMAPGGEPAKGKAAIVKHFTTAIEAGAGAQNAITTEQVMAAGDWAVEVGGFVVTAADGSHADHGRYMATWKQVGGKWMLYRDIWNSSMRP